MDEQSSVTQEKNGMCNSDATYRLSPEHPPIKVDMDGKVVPERESTAQSREARSLEKLQQLFAAWWEDQG